MLIIGVAGGTGSGKTTLVSKLSDYFQSRVSCLSHDSYYRDLSHLSLDDRRKVNFDHPDSLETTLLIKHLKQLRQGRAVTVPVYDFFVSNRTKQTKRVEPKPIVIVEGILLFENKALRELFDIKVFIDAEADIRLGRRITRDMKERGRTLDFSLKQYLNKSKPMHDQFVEPNKRYADLIIPGGGNNKIALKVLIDVIQNKL